MKTPAEIIEADLVLMSVLGPPSGELRVGFKIYNWKMYVRRQLLGLTIKGLGRKASISARKIGSFESFKSFPSRDQAQRIAAELLTTASDLFPDWLRECLLNQNCQELMSTCEEVQTALRISCSKNQPALIRSVDDESTNPVVQAEEVDRDDILTEMFSRLNPQERIALKLRFGLDGLGERSFKAVGSTIGVGQSRGRAIVLEALAKLRRQHERMLSLANYV